MMMTMHVANHSRGLAPDKLTEPEAMFRTLIYRTEQYHGGCDFWDIVETTFDAQTTYAFEEMPETEVTVTIKVPLYDTPFPLVDQEQLKAIQKGVPVEDVLA